MGHTLPNIVVIGGGSGSSTVLQGLKELRCDVTAIVTMFDSGGSSGILREEFGYPPLGDLRRCLVALSEDSEAPARRRTGATPADSPGGAVGRAAGQRKAAQDRNGQATDGRPVEIRAQGRGDPSGNGRARSEDPGGDARESDEAGRLYAEPRPIGGDAPAGDGAGRPYAEPRIEEREVADALRMLVEFRFDQDSSLNGHSLGNLLMAALTTLRHDVEGAIDMMSRLLRVRGQVVPVALEGAELCAELEDGTILCGESNIDLRGRRTPRIQRVFLKPGVAANPRAIHAILDADAIVLGPGDLYTSILPNLLVDGIAQAIRDTRAVRMYVCNLMTKLGETDDFRASDFVREIAHYLSGGSSHGGPVLDWAIVNDRAIPDELLAVYAAEQAEPVELDRAGVSRYVGGVFSAPLANNCQPLRHDPYLLAEQILGVLGSGRRTFSLGLLDTGELASTYAPETNGHQANGNGHVDGYRGNGRANGASHAPAPMLAAPDAPQARSGE